MTSHMDPSSEFSTLMSNLVEGGLTPSQFDRLAEILESDSAARAVYRDHLSVHAMLYWRWHQQTSENQTQSSRPETIATSPVEEAARQSIAEPSSSIPLLDAPDVAPSTYGLFSNVAHGAIGFFSQELPFALLIATLITGLGLLAGSFIYVTHHQQLADNGSTTKPTPPPLQTKLDYVGRITGMVDVQWSDAQTATVHGANVSLGRKYALSSGLMEITYKTGAKVILQGPVTYKVDSRDGGYLSLGKLTARLEKKQSAISGQQSEPAAGMANHKSEITNQKSLASSPQPLAPNSNPQSLIPNPSLSTLHSPLFTIKTPTAVITDLGTEFGVEVNRDGATQTVVFVGEVLASPANQSVSHEKPIHLSSGDAVSIDSAKCFKTINGTTIAKQFVRSIIAGNRGNRPNEQGFSFSENFRTPGIQAKTAGAFLANYPLWTFQNDVGDKTSFVTVEPSGRLALMHPGKVFSNPTITITAKAISGKTKFDVSQQPLTISIKMGARGTSLGWFDARLWLGEMLVDLYPEYGVIRVRDRTGEKVFEEGYTIRQNEMCSLVLTIMENDGKYKCNIAYSDDSGVSTSKTFWIAKENAGELDRLSLGCQQGCPDSAAFFSDLSVVQEPY